MSFHYIEIIKIKWNKIGKDKTAKKEVVSVKVLHLEGCVIVPCDLKKHSFEIKTLDNKSAIFAVDSLEQTVLWINGLKFFFLLFLFPIVLN